MEARKLSSAIGAAAGWAGEVGKMDAALGGGTGVGLVDNPTDACVGCCVHGTHTRGEGSGGRG